MPASASLEAVAKLEKTPVFCNEPVSLVVTVSWRGQQSDYRVGVPKIALPEGIIRTGVSSKSFRAGDTFQIVYTWRLEIRKCGELTIDSIEVDYLAKDNDKTFTKRIAGFSFIAEKKPLLSGLTLWFVAGLIGTGFGAIVWLSLAWRKKRRGRAESDHVPLCDEERQSWQDRLERCRKLKAHGELQRFFDEAFRLHREINNRLPESLRADTTTERFAGLVEQVKYGGGKPHNSETETYFRALERIVHDASNR